MRRPATTGWQVARGVALLATFAATTGCYDLIASRVSVDVQVVSARPNFLDEALAHRYVNRYTIAGADTPRFGSRIPVWQIADEANRRLAGKDFDQAMAYLESNGCERTTERSCAYRRTLRQIIEGEEEQRRLVTLHFTMLPRGCTRCVEVRLEIGERIAS